MQAKVGVSHRVWDSCVWDPKLPNSKKCILYIIKINKSQNQTKKRRRNKAKLTLINQHSIL